MLDWMTMNASSEEMENFYSRCLLCTCIPDVTPHLNIFSGAGNKLQLSEKINKYLNIQISPELPQKVCQSCMEKLEVTHELVTSSQQARVTLLHIKQQSGNLVQEEVPMDNTDSSNSTKDMDQSNSALLLNSTRAQESCPDCTSNLHKLKTVTRERDVAVSERDSTKKKYIHLEAALKQAEKTNHTYHKELKDSISKSKKIVDFLGNLKNIACADKALSKYFGNDVCDLEENNQISPSKDHSKSVEQVEESTGKSDVTLNLKCIETYELADLITIQYPHAAQQHVDSESGDELMMDIEEVQNVDMDCADQETNNTRHNNSSFYWQLRHTKNDVDVCPLYEGCMVFTKNETYNSMLDTKSVSMFLRTMIPCVLSDQALQTCCAKGTKRGGRKGLQRRPGLHRVIYSAIIESVRKHEAQLQIDDQLKESGIVKIINDILHHQKPKKK